MKKKTIIFSIVLSIIGFLSFLPFFLESKTVTEIFKRVFIVIISILPAFIFSNIIYNFVKVISAKILGYKIIFAYIFPIIYINKEFKIGSIGNQILGLSGYGVYIDDSKIEENSKKYINTYIFIYILIYLIIIFISLYFKNNLLLLFTPFMLFMLLFEFAFDKSSWKDYKIKSLIIHDLYYDDNKTEEYLRKYNYEFDIKDGNDMSKLCFLSLLKNYKENNYINNLLKNIEKDMFKLDNYITKEKYGILDYLKVNLYTLNKENKKEYNYYYEEIIKIFDSLLVNDKNFETVGKISIESIEKRKEIKYLSFLISDLSVFIEDLIISNNK